MAKDPVKPTPPVEGIPEGFRSAVGAVMRADRAAGGLIRNAAHGAASLAAKHPEAAVGAIGGAVIGHKLAKGIDKALPQGQHLTRGAKVRWAASGALAGGLAGAGLAAADRLKRESEIREDSYYVGYHLQGKSPNAAKVFRSPTLLNGYTHRKFGHVEGPFASRQDAEDTVRESLVAVFNEEVDRINEATSDKFTPYLSNGAIPNYPHLNQAIKAATGDLRGSGGNMLAADIKAKTARGEEPIGYVDGDGFHYNKPELRKKRIPEMRILESDYFARVTKDGYLLGVHPYSHTGEPRWSDEYDSEFAPGDAETRILRGVPDTLGSRLMKHGTSAQDFSDGYEAWDAAYSYMKEGITFASRPMSFQARVKEKIREVELSEKEKWMQSVHPKKGALHKQLGISADQKISTSALKAAANKGGLLAKRANLALRYRGE